MSKKIENLIINKHYLEDQKEYFKSINKSNDIIEKYFPPKDHQSNEFLKFLQEQSNNVQCTYFAHHYIRYFKTFSNISKINKNIKNKIILETGGPSPISIFLSKYNECFYSESDLRDYIDSENNSLDYIFSFELIEHLKDISSDNDSHIFKESGIKNYASEVNRILKPNGHLFLTTPNPCSAHALEKLINYEAPMIWRPHVREYTSKEIENYFLPLILKNYKTINAFSNLKNEGKFFKKLKKIKSCQQFRGDDHFMHFEKN